MRTLAIVIAAFAVLQFPQLAEAGNPVQPGGAGFVDTNHPKVTKDYYIVREARAISAKSSKATLGQAFRGGWRRSICK